jgi:porin
MKKIFYLLIFIVFEQSIYAQTEDDAFQFGASYIGESQNNLSGGIKRGSGYLGMANLSLEFNTEAAGFWKGGQFFVSGANTHGQTPSSELYGDYQVASNIEAGNHTFLQELWYKHTIGNVSLTLGLQDLNSEFV